MNEIIKSLYDRKSVRVYEDRPIPEKMKQIILEAAAQAPSAGCQQLYTILDITDQKLKDELVKTCDNQPFIATAPMVLVFCADCKKWYDAYLEAGCSPRKPGRRRPDAGGDGYSDHSPECGRRRTELRMAPVISETSWKIVKNSAEF